MIAASVVLNTKPSTDLPIWSAGDSWTYVETGMSSPFPPSGFVTYTVNGTETFALAGGVVSAYQLVVTSRFVANGTVSRIADEWLRTSDLAVVRRSVILVTCYTLSPNNYTCNPVTWTSTLEPPLRLDFPLTTGDSWSASAAVYTERLNVAGAPSTWYNTSGGANDSVGAPETVTVLAGRFTAIPLTLNYSGAAGLLSSSYVPYVVRYYAAAAGNAVEERDYGPPTSANGTRNLVASMELASYVYAPPWYLAKALGFPVWAWLAVGAAIALAAVLLARRRRAKRTPAESGPPQAPPAKP